MRNFGIGIILILLLTLFVHVETTTAASGQTYEVGVNILHVREAADGDADIIGLLQQGDKLTAFQEKYGWVQTYYAGEPAWVAKHYLIPTGSTTTSSQKSMSSATASITVTESSVNIRSGPGLDYRVVAGTSQGETFNAIDHSGEWIQISLSNGQTGWIASWLTDSIQSPKEQKNRTNTAAQSSSIGSLSGYTIVLDAGHGGRDPGAIGLRGLYEKDLVYDTTSTIAQTLRNYGATVIETRTGDYYLSLDERASISNTHYTDAFISVHYNSFPVVSVQGINTFYSSDAGYALAKDIHSSLTSTVPLNNRGMGKENYKVLRNTIAPAILLELGFITNAYDLSIIQTADYQNQVADAIAKGLIQYFR
ncbi:N-acetylmuramoyl-L-alanine amidase [Oceanobacillus luteolus]|uniref:N-acetylmuramoyl-L-alanine amidase n=1 Tax=Oceanobacillus luteolus TaxID=1274358 RepID=A0ABW4HL23_9BACI|nr:N-acetylmuramoyl-L-alanine amidase [Oceanobacillus luteolus]MCM3740725.1 N-acetylmuramoyl-L-alanine amidase [Oceanobacillus luteolus]